ncbi:MAG: apolipoprotein N-acyltransferase [Bryobacter sp.]|nr:apolipoprotein N-acyltransferase [Bryobacter sp.]
MKPAINWLLAILSGLLLVMIAPGPSLVFLAPFALTPLLISVADEVSGRRRFLLGWVAGIIQWGGMCHWIAGTLAMHGGMGPAVAGALFVGFSLVKGLHMGFYAWAVGPVFAARWAPLALALLWAGLERTHGELGFTWLLLGNAAADMGVPLRLAPFTGVYGISFCFALVGASLAAWYLRRERWQLAWCAVLIALYALPGLPEPRAGELTAIVAQPNFPEDQLPTDRRLHEAYSRLARLTLEEALRPQLGKADLLLWPEMPASLYYELDAKFREQTGSLARLSAAPFLFSTVRFDEKGNPYNTAQMLTANGDAAGTYDKMNLVPFGEFVPPVFNAFVDKVSQEAGTFQPGKAIQVFPTPGGKLGVFICYESVFAEHVREITRQGATVLVNLSNDGYFSSRAAQEQHLRIARMRAAENGRWLLRPTNDGISAVMDPAGRVVEQMEPEKLAVERMSYGVACPGELTPYTRYGDWFAWLALGLGLGLVAYCWRTYA